MTFRTAYGNTHSENGWRMCNRDECDLVRIPELYLTETAPLRTGPPLVILGAWLYWYDRNVEEITTNVWGWSATNDVGDSNHLSGTAVDINAPQYPWGQRVMPKDRIAKIREGLRLFEGTVVWGADWQRADEMHYQMNYAEGDPRNKAFADKLLEGHLGIYTPDTGNLTAATLAEVMGRVNGVDYGGWYGPMLDAMRLAQITTIERAAMWFAQLGHESGGLYYQEEIADGSKYEGRADLGNTRPGDGRRFKGRGPIQLTGRSNYTRFSEWAFTKRLVTSPTYFVDHPTDVATKKWGLMAAVWYWTVARDMNSYADRRDIEGGSIAVNGRNPQTGRANGIEDRLVYYRRALTMGTKLLPPPKGNAMAGEIADSELSKRFPSRSKYRISDDPIDTGMGYVLNIDARIHETWIMLHAFLGDQACIDLVAREAAKGDAASQTVLDKIKGATK